MNILWLAWEDLYASRRMREAAKKAKVNLDTVQITNLSFIADAKKKTVGVYKDKINVVRRYDVLCVRTFFPYISEALTVAKFFKDARKLVVEEALTDNPYVISKMYDYMLLQQNGVAVPRSWQFYDRQRTEAVAKQLGFPCVLKSVHGGQGLHVHRVNNVDQLRRRLRQYPDGNLVLQEFLSAEEDYRVLVVGYKALPILLIRHPRPGDFRTNFAVEGEGISLDLKDFPKLRELAENSARILRREFAGVDIRADANGNLKVLEVNRRPDFEGFELATHYDVAGEVVKYIKEKWGQCLNR